MNGRIYDSALGRFLQADPIIQEPNNPQNFNRYSYVLNNPLSLTDPSGFNFLGEAFKFLRPLAAIAISIYAPGLLAVYLGQFGSVVAAGFLAGVVSTGTLKGGLVGAFSAAAFAGVGSAFDKYGTRGNFLGSDFSRGAFGAKVLSHGITGGVMAELQGGKFGSGFAAAGVTQAFSGGIDGLDQGTVGISAERVFAAAVLGGTTSALTGGKFANGAITGAFSRAFNDEQELRNLERERRLADEAITRSNAALRSSGAIGREFSSIDEASIAFADAVLPMANELGVEIASQFTDIGNGKILLSLATSDGRTGTVNPFLAPSTGAQPIGFIHTHPDAGLLSGWDTSTALSYVSGAGKVFVGHAVVVNAKGAIAKWDTKYQRQDYVRFRG